MKRIALIAFLLGGCATTGGVSSVPPNLAPVIQQAQQIAVAICAFEPTAATIAGILATGNPILQTAEAIATAICTAVAPVKTSDAGDIVFVADKPAPKKQPTVNGVPVRGRFVK